ncbi:MAG: ShlB/FhaC/HecB family hemolysin secretion/activation protein, partial [Gammaproteobacteria bacterium]
TLFGDEELSALVAGYLDRPVSLLELYEAADRIAAYYVERGYTLASVNLPPQKISDGTVALQVSEGRVARIDVDNAAWYRPSHVRAYLGDFRTGQIYRSGPLQEGLRALNTLPGLSARATVKPGTAPGTSDVVVKLDETHFAGGVSLDNYGREAVGEYRLSASALLNNPLRVEDQLQLAGLVSEDELTRFGSLSYSVPLNFSGTRVRASYAHAEFSVDGSPVDGRSRSGELVIEQPLLHDARQRLVGSFGPSRTLSNADFSGLIFNQTEITLWKLGLAYTRTHANASVTQIGTAVSSNFQSLSIEDLAASEVDSDQRLKWELDLQHLMQLSRAFQLYMHVNGAWSPDPLIDTEKYSLGGPTSVRGYPGAEIRGDQGYFASLSLQHSLPLGPATLRSRVFVDGGQVFSVDAPDAGSLSSIGLGFDVSLRPVLFRLDWAYPLGNREVSDGRDSGRAFGALSASF